VLGPGGGEKLDGLAAYTTLRAALRAALGKGKAGDAAEGGLREVA